MIGEITGQATGQLTGEMTAQVTGNITAQTRLNLHMFFFFTSYTKHTN
jgi:hypothetical protein